MAGDLASIGSLAGGASLGSRRYSGSLYPSLGEGRPYSSRMRCLAYSSLRCAKSSSNGPMYLLYSSRGIGLPRSRAYSSGAGRSRNNKFMSDELFNQHT